MEPTMHERNMRAIRDQEAREAAIPNKVEVLGQELAAAFAAQFLPMNFQRRRDLPRFEAWLQHWLHKRFPDEDHPKIAACADASNRSKIHFPGLASWLAVLVRREEGLVWTPMAAPAGTNRMSNKEATAVLDEAGIDAAAVERGLARAMALVEAAEKRVARKETVMSDDKVRQKANEIRMELLAELRAAKDLSGGRKADAVQDIAARAETLNRITGGAFGLASALATVE